MVEPEITDAVDRDTAYTISTDSPVYLGRFELTAEKTSDSQCYLPVVLVCIIYELGGTAGR